MHTYPGLKPRKGFKYVTIHKGNIRTQPLGPVNTYQYAVSPTTRKLIIYDISDRDVKLGWIERRREFVIDEGVWLVMTKGKCTTSTWRGKNGDGSIGKREVANFIWYVYYVFGPRGFTYTETKAPV